MKNFIQNQLKNPSVKSVFNMIAPLHTKIERPLGAFLAVAGPVAMGGAGVYLARHGASYETVGAATLLAVTGGLLTKQYTLPTLRRLKAGAQKPLSTQARPSLTPAE